MTDRDTARFWTYKVFSKEYTPAEIAAVGQGTFGPRPADPEAAYIASDNRRKIPIQSFPTGMLLYHYFKFPERNYGETDETYRGRLWDVLLGQNGVPITYNAATNTWRLCFGSVVTNYHYYYPNPSAGFGIDGYGLAFNAALHCYTTRSSKWAYLKSGTSVREERVNHRRFPMTDGFPNYDYLRLQTCDRINAGLPNPGYCRPGNAYDICMTPEFQRENYIDGVVSVARMDDLMDIRKNHFGQYTFNNAKNMYTAVNNWFQKIVDHGNLAEDRLMWMMNLLCLESDFKPKEKEINVGFKEFANGPFGSRRRIPARDLQNVARYGTQNVDYTVVEEQFEGGTCVKRVFEFQAGGGEFVSNFFLDYVIPHLLVKPDKLVTQLGTISVPAGQMYFDIEQAVPIIAPIAGAWNADELRYQLNHNIATALYPMTTGNPANMLHFDYRLNVFLKAEAGRYNPNTNLAIQFRFNPEHIGILPPGHPLQNPPHTRVGYPVGNYADPLDRNRQKQLQLKKIIHEYISNSKWTSRWMCEVLFDTVNIPYVAQRLFVPVGPFYNRMCIPFTNYDDIPEVYRYIVSLLEQPSYGQINVQHSQSYEMLNDPSIRQYLMEWATNGTYNYFSPRLGTLGHPNQYPYFAGRWFNDILEDGEFIGGSRSTRKARRNASAEHDILTDEVFVQNFKKNFLKLKRRTNRKTPKRNSGNKHTTNKKKNKIPANRTPNYTEGEGGHTSTNIIPMSEDTFQTLVSLFQDPLYKPMLLMLFQGGDTTEE